MTKALVAMSGGVDSSVAAFLMIEKGFDCTGAMMKLYSNENIGIGGENGCCSLADAEDARAVAYSLGIAFYVFNFTDCFKEQIIQRFVDAYKSGLTPNPCIDCNKYVKFNRFLRRACEIEMDYVVTGHYARVEYDKNSKRYLLKKGIDYSRDQSYVLYGMTQEQLSQTLFPLGELHKSQVREIAIAQGFVNAKKRDSQDICFVPNGNYSKFIEGYIGVETKKGRFIDTCGNDLGEHKGIIHYTIGQRKGIGLSMPTPVYVCRICPDSNTVVLGKEDELYTKSLTAKCINLIPFEKLATPIKAKAKVRYRQPEQPVTVCQIDSDTLHLLFDRPQRAVTRGQAVVLYDDDVVIGGGTIV